MYFEDLGLQVPESMAEGEDKVLQLTHEIESIESQLEKNTEPKPDQTDEAFHEWRTNAEKALSIKKRQQDAMSQWVALHKTKVENAQPDVLVYEAFQVFSRLKDRGVPLERDERTFMSVLECYLRDRTGMVS
jgi:ElaB/YqjD/DUF883 family membrane-anchored ribosome-binding protein